MYQGQACWLHLHVLSCTRCLPIDMSAMMHMSDSHFWTLDSCPSRGVLPFEERGLPGLQYCDFTRRPKSLEGLGIRLGLGHVKGSCLQRDSQSTRLLKAD